jgi:hypothetical protein
VGTRHVRAQVDGILALVHEQEVVPPRPAASVARDGAAKGEQPRSERAPTFEPSQMAVDEEEHFMDGVLAVRLGDPEPRQRAPHEVRVELIGLLERHRFRHVVST